MSRDRMFPPALPRPPLTVSPMCHIHMDFKSLQGCDFITAVGSLSMRSFP